MGRAFYYKSYLNDILSLNYEIAYIYFVCGLRRIWRSLYHTDKVDRNWGWFETKYRFVDQFGMDWFSEYLFFSNQKLCFKESDAKLKNSFWLENEEELDVKTGKG